jgi:hypothetical protein
MPPAPESGLTEPESRLEGYAEWLATVKAQIRAARQRAA